MTLSDLLADEGLAPHSDGSKRELISACPFCRVGDKCYTNPRKQVYICFSCGERGTLWRLLQRGLGLDYFRASRLLHELSQQDTPYVVPPTPEPAAPCELPKGWLSLATVLRKNAAPTYPYLDYLRQRHVNDEQISFYGIGLTLTDYPYFRRVVIPVETEGELRTFVARTIDRGTQPKVLYPPGSQKGRALFNIDRLWGKEHIVLVEGVFDALRLEEEAVAALGSRLSSYQRLLLRRSGARSITILFDGDDPGIAGAVVEGQCLLSDGFEVHLALLRGKDPGEAAGVEIQQALAEARPISTIVTSQRALLDKLRGPVLH